MKRVMSIAKIVPAVIVVIASLILIAVVLLQSGKNSGLTSAIGGQHDTYLGQHQSSSADARLARLTKWVAFIFLLAILILNLV